MSNKWIKQYKNNDVHFHRMKNVTKPFICPICTHVIHVGDEMIRVSNNHNLFPSIFIHGKCDHENSIDLIKASWEQALKLRLWFE